MGQDPLPFGVYNLVRLTFDGDLLDDDSLTFDVPSFVAGAFSLARECSYLA